MRVETSGTHPPIAQPTTNAASRVGTKATEAAASSPETGSFEPTGELAQLLGLVRQSPDVRADAVQHASAKVASGELNTREAANETARALIASGETATP